MSSAAGAGNAVLGWLSMRGSSTSMTSRSHPSSRSASPAVVTAAIGAASAIMNSIRAAGTAGSIGRYAAPVLSTAKIATIASSGPRKQQRHTLHPGPHPGRPTGAPTGSPPHQARGRSTSAPRKLSATASGVRATCAANNTGIDTGAVTGWVNTARLPTHPGGHAHPHRADPPTTTAALGSAVIATNTRSNRSAKSQTSQFEKNCPAPAVLRKS